MHMQEGRLDADLADRPGQTPDLLLERLRPAAPEPVLPRRKRSSLNKMLANSKKCRASFKLHSARAKPSGPSRRKRSHSRA